MEWNGIELFIHNQRHTQKIGTQYPDPFGGFNHASPQMING